MRPLLLQSASLSKRAFMLMRVVVLDTVNSAQQLATIVLE